MRLAVSIALATLVTSAAAEPPAARPAFDHYEPLALEQAASAILREGDRDTACILIDRAVRITPHDRRIAAGIDELERKVAAPQKPVPAPTSRAALDLPPEPPALWPSR